jgi:1-deoxy-D-xylulose-5-phosphate synthase
VLADFEKGNAPSCVFVSYGNITANVIKAQAILESEGIGCGIILAEKLKPYGESVSLVAQYIAGASAVVFVEEAIKNGGYSMITESMLRSEGYISENVKTAIMAIDDNFVIPKEKCDVYDYAGLSPKKIANKMKEIIKRTI